MPISHLPSGPQDRPVPSQHECNVRLNVAQVLALIQIENNNLGVFLLRSGDAHRAVEEFSRAVQLDPNFLEASENLSRATAGEQ